MSALNLTIDDCRVALAWALAKVALVPYRADSWNSFEFLIREAALGPADAGATAYKCRVGYNVDFDIRCSCCGTILEMGSIDIDGPTHALPDDGANAPVIIVRSAAEIAEAFGSKVSPRFTPNEAAAEIFRTLSRAAPCSCP
jgi:hypothetical protein